MSICIRLNRRKEQLKQIQGHSLRVNALKHQELRRVFHPHQQTHGHNCQWFVKIPLIWWKESFEWEGQVTEVADDHTIEWNLKEEWENLEDQIRKSKRNMNKFLSYWFNRHQWRGLVVTLHLDWKFERKARKYMALYSTA